LEKITQPSRFDERFWLALGSGQALNEHITGTKWPSKRKRNQRLQESVDIIRRLLEGERVNHSGLVKVEDAKLFTLPEKHIPLIGAAITSKTAGWLAGWADGLITLSKPLEELKKTVREFRQNGGDGKPMYLKVQVSSRRH
jgi:coenzyme F420-dependent glucose-6-phosphate dehydrogenase